MAYLDKIVNNINEAISQKLTAFPTAIYYGVSYPVTSTSGKVQNVIPAVIDITGYVKEISFNDIPQLTIYHKLSSSTYSQIKSSSYGDGYSDFQHNMDMDLIVMGDRKKLNVQPESLEVAIASNIPGSIKIESANYVNIFPTSANHNSRQLFSQEYPGANFFLKPEYIYFSIRYRVEIRYQKGCISLCQC